MLAKETPTPFSDKEWIFEIKWDGYRAIAEVDGKDVKLYSRNGNTFNASYPIVVDALKKMKLDATLDGEIVVMDDKGRSNFQLLQYYGTDDEVAIEYRVFDLLSLNGKDTCGLTLIQRKELLEKLLNLKKNDIVKYSDHISTAGEAFFKATEKEGLEGIMAKKADSLYSPGVRTTEWLKIKHHKTEEVIVCGFTSPGGSRQYFGALILGMMKGDELVYVGHTGSGFNHQGLKDAAKMLKPLIVKKSPFTENIKTNAPATWVKPVLVCEVKYTEWTKDGNLRHPIFLRWRTDKKPNEVRSNMVTKSKPKKEKTKAAVKTPDADNTISFGKTKVNVTNLNKIFWPKEKITKGDVINYYRSISKYILPYLKDRPQSLKRNPNGIKDTGFYHKDAGEDAPSFVKTKAIFSESANKDIDYIICNNEATLTYLNNLGCIELNPWHSTIQKLDKPDYLIIDIDPSEKNTFEQVIESAHVVNDICQKAGVVSYCKTSGATGMHIYIPTQKKYTYEQLKDFAHLICMMTQEQLPKFTSLERNLKKRGNKMIYLDHLQNRRGQTISSVYSLRPKEGAPVSMPLLWKEVKLGLSPLDFTIHNALKRIEKAGDIFKGVLGKGIDLEKCLKRLE
jgi:bifunctional non-homologous end joining protein LigD